MSKQVLLIGIFILAVFMRFFQLNVNPPSLTWDEASWGINAYALSVSGKDEFGKFLPISYLESFGDFKPPMYAYLTVIPVWMFGLNEFSVRFASAFFGSLSVILCYFLVKEIFFTMKKKEQVSLIASFLLAISPWHILLSRAAFEANVATFFIILGVLLFLFSTREKRNMKFFVFSLIAFVCAFYTFNTSRVFLPPFVFALFILKRKALLGSIKQSIFSVITAFIIAIPVLLFMVTPQAQLRFQEVNIFSDISVIERTNQEMANSNNSILSKIIHNRRLAYGVEFIKHYFDNLDPKFLFITGDGNPKFSIQDIGQMYVWELPFLIVGVLFLFRKKDGNWVVLPFWILLGIIPAATARETPHALRIETVVPAFQIITAYGIFWSICFIKNTVKDNMLRKSIWIGSSMLILLFFAYFVHNYFVHYPITYAAEWQYGYKDAIKFTESQKDNYQNIYFTQDLGRPYAYLLFYGKYPIDVLQKDALVNREALGFVHVDRVGKYQFPKMLPKPEIGSLYVETSGKVPANVKILKTIELPNNEPSLIIYEK